MCYGQKDRTDKPMKAVGNNIILVLNISGLRQWISERKVKSKYLQF